VDAEEFERQNAEFKQALSELKRQAGQARAAPGQAAMVEGLLDKLVEGGADECQAAICQLSRSQQRQVVQALTKRVAIGDDGRVEILYRFAHGGR
jgi:hypothetical protein